MTKSIDPLKFNFNNKKEVKNWEMERGFPYIIHACPLVPGELYPTHTHGRAVFQEPEYLINARSFGIENGKVINFIHKYFECHPDHKARVLNHQTVELSFGDEMILCMREVGSSFQAVRNAYEGFDFDGMKFIQIYVKGDGFALTDEYYQAGEPF